MVVVVDMVCIIAADTTETTNQPPPIDTMAETIAIEPTGYPVRRNLTTDTSRGPLPKRNRDALHRIALACGRLYSGESTKLQLRQPLSYHDGLCLALYWGWDVYQRPVGNRWQVLVGVKNWDKADLNYYSRISPNTL